MEEHKLATKLLTKWFSKLLLKREHVWMHEILPLKYCYLFILTDVDVISMSSEDHR